MYRFVVTLLQPFTFLVLEILVATLLLWRWPRPARRHVLIGLSALVGLLVLISLPPVGHLAVASLEWPYPPRDEMPEGVDTIVVLSGGIHVYDRTGKHAELAPDTLSRCLHASELYHRGGGCRVVVSGGKVKADRPGPTLASAMREFLIQVGVKRADLLTEGQSTSTYENAVECRRLLAPLGVRRIVLVTSASHMRRASRCFQKQGFEVLPAAGAHQATWFRWDAEAFLPSAEAVGEVEAAAHEWLGLVWYWLHGRI